MVSHHDYPLEEFSTGLASLLGSRDFWPSTIPWDADEGVEFLPRQSGTFGGETDRTGWGGIHFDRFKSPSSGRHSPPRWIMAWQFAHTIAKSASVVMIGSSLPERTLR